jgi:hypothetical protein
MTALARPAAILNDRLVLSQRGYYIRTITGSVHLIKNTGRETQVVWHQEELIAGKPPVVK